MKRYFPIALSLLVMLLTTGCQEYLLHGLVYTHVTIPLTSNLDRTPVPQHPDKGQGRMIRITEPFTGYGLYTEIYSNAIGDIARKHGVNTVYFADQELYSILGVWTSSTIHIYGE